MFQFDKLLLRELPRLYNHFKAKQLQLEVGGEGERERAKRTHNTIIPVKEC